MKQASKIIVYLERQKITIAAIGLETPINLDIPTNVVFDIEIVDPESLDVLIATCLEQNKIVPSEVIIVLSSTVYYERNANPTTDAALKKNQIDAFLQIIPYKNLFFKDFVLGDQLKFIAINKEFYEPVVKFFEKRRFNVIAILPVFILDFLHLNLTEYNSKEVDAIYKKSKLVLPYSLISAADINKSMETSVHQPEENKTRTTIMLVFFCVLWIILLGLIFVRPILLKKSYTNQLQKTMATLPTANPARPNPVASPTPTPILLSMENTRVKIVNSSGVAKQATTIKAALAVAGFKQITTATSTQIINEKSQVNYSSAVSTEVLEKLIATLETVTGEVTTKQTENMDDTDITITTGLNTRP